MPESPSSESRLVALDNQVQALQMRRSGWTFQRIAEKLGYASPSGAHNAVKRALDRTIREPADELRQHELGRLESLHEALWDKAVGGDLRTTDRILKIAERRAKLVGLDKLAEGFMSPAEIQQALVTLVSIAQKHLKTPEEREAMLLDVQRLIGAGGMVARPPPAEAEDTTKDDTSTVDIPAEPILPEHDAP